MKKSFLELVNTIHFMIDQFVSPSIIQERRLKLTEDQIDELRQILNTCKQQVNS